MEEKKKDKHKKCDYLSMICRQTNKRTRPRLGEGDEQRPRVGEEDELGSCRQTKRRTRPGVGEGDELGYQFTENLKLEREIDLRQHKSRRKL